MPIDFFMTLNVFVVSLVLLVLTSQAAIKYSVRFAKLTGISQLAIGFLLLAVATSLPELSIAVLSSLYGEGLLSVGNVLGANISNLLLIFGVLALIRNFAIKKEQYGQVLRAVTVTTLIAFVAYLLGFINMIFGLTLLVMFFIFSWTIMRSGYSTDRTKPDSSAQTVAKTGAIVLGCVTLVVLSGRLVTDAAITIAGELGVGESLIGATILAIGTTLPELSVNIAAIRRGAIGLAVGDSIGSIITNLTLVLGTAATINSITLGPVERAVALAFIGTALLFLFLSARATFNRRLGLILLGLYALYIIGISTYGAIV
ncbi:MAG: hypothetical protein QW751_01735 [Candidatus Aenigmatarchaeota archaeon]